jgi:hypothetical protein
MGALGKAKLCQSAAVCRLAIHGCRLSIMRKASSTELVIRILLHIGRPRTGTTAFQSGIANNNCYRKGHNIRLPIDSDLAPRSMQLFYAAVGDHLGKIHPWHQTNFDGKSLEHHVAKALDSASQDDTVVISNEWFSMNYAPAQFGGMIKLLEQRAPVEVFVILRPQGDAAVSAWSRLIMDRDDPGQLSEVTAPKTDWGRKLKPLNYVFLISEWS